MNHIGTRTITTERFVLRRFKLEDAQQMFNNYCSDDDVTKYLTWASHKSVQDTIEFLCNRIPKYENPNFYSWAIVDKQTNQVVGDITLSQNKTDVQRASIAWVIAKNYWNKGCMTECASAVLNYLKLVGYKEINAIHFLENVASGKVMKKLGFKYIGIIENHARNNKGELKDVECYAFIM